MRLVHIESTLIIFSFSKNRFSISICILKPSFSFSLLFLVFNIIQNILELIDILFNFFLLFLNTFYFQYLRNLFL
jgi:hypothetical protein